MSDARLTRVEFLYEVEDKPELYTTRGTIVPSTVMIKRRGHEPYTALVSGKVIRDNGQIVKQSASITFGAEQHPAREMPSWLAVLVAEVRQMTIEQSWDGDEDASA